LSFVTVLTVKLIQGLQLLLVKLVLTLRQPLPLFQNNFCSPLVVVWAKIEKFLLVKSWWWFSKGYHFCQNITKVWL